MNHHLGELIYRHLHCKRGLSQNRLAQVIDLDPAVISDMCHGRRLTGPYARERVIKIIQGLHGESVLTSVDEANALLMAAGLVSLHESQPEEAALLQRLRTQSARDIQRPTRNFLDPVPGESPFKELHYFDESDGLIFFGREQLTAKLVGRLRENRFLAVVGTPGSGKSSIIRAGVIPALKRGELLADGTFPPEGSSKWAVHVLTPTAHPLEALATSLTHDLQEIGATSTLIDDLARDARCLHLYARKILSRASSQAKLGCPSGCLLLILDQFEEIFTLCQSEAERQAFINNLVTAIQTDGPTVAILTLRADFYAHCGPFPNLRELLAWQQEYIGSMSAEESRRAIEASVRLAAKGEEAWRTRSALRKQTGEVHEVANPLVLTID